MGGEVVLNAGRLRLELTPAVGGAISAFTWTDGDSAVPIMRACPHPLDKVLDASCFPLVPYVNRVRGGTFTFRGRDIELKPNMAGDPSPLHGQGWLNPWAVESSSERDAALRYAHEPGEWPWRYDATQHFTLNEQGLGIRLSCRNRSEDPMPCGLGLHPYFPCGPATRIDTRVTDVWTVDTDVLPIARVPATGRYALQDRPACGQDLDNGFGGWDGEARMTDPDWPFALRLSSHEAHFFQLYSPPEGGIFVAEPVTHANAALNAPEAEWLELGLRVLEAGEEMHLAMRLDVRPA